MIDVSTWTEKKEAKIPPVGSWCFKDIERRCYAIFGTVHLNPKIGTRVAKCARCGMGFVIDEYQTHLQDTKKV